MGLQWVVRAGIDAVDRKRKRSDDVCAHQSRRAERIVSRHGCSRKIDPRRDVPSSFGSANTTMYAGRISGMPPTRVLTTRRPDEAASMSAVPKASVSDVLRKICPRCST
jgi:hypothetical protein